MDEFVVVLSDFLFFFSSRRRHTRWPRDWSSDVCSSDLAKRSPETNVLVASRIVAPACSARFTVARSEERRVGKECRLGKETAVQKKKKGVIPMRFMRSYYLLMIVLFA